jgi:NADPH-dependent 2,4-dienoyl-CoA reductase/sulfur reductase-like enzyme
VIRPKIPGLDLENVFQLHSIYDADAILQKVRSAGVKNVVVVGGGYIGLEMAEALAALGKKVTIVELAPQIATLFDEDIAGVLKQYVEKKGITIPFRRLEALEGKQNRRRYELQNRRFPQRRCSAWESAPALTSGKRTEDQEGRNHLSE